jgi:hypothetical protein
VNDADSSAYYLDLKNRSNCSHIESAKPGKKFIVLVRNEADKTAQPIQATARLEENGKSLFIEVETPHGKQTHDHIYSDLIAYIRDHKPS